MAQTDMTETGHKAALYLCGVRGVIGVRGQRLRRRSRPLLESSTNRRSVKNLLYSETKQKIEDVLDLEKGQMLECSWVLPVPLCIW